MLSRLLFMLMIFCTWLAVTLREKTKVLRSKIFLLFLEWTITQNFFPSFLISVLKLNRKKLSKKFFCLLWTDVVFSVFFELTSSQFLPFQFLNVYCTKYDTGGLYWPIAHNATIFSLVLTQIICLGVFALKKSPVAAGFTVPLIIFTLLFFQYCRKRHLPLFKSFPAQVSTISFFEQ